MNKVISLEMHKDINDLALLSEESFAKTWLNKEEDEAWKRTCKNERYFYKIYL